MRHHLIDHIDHILHNACDSENYDTHWPCKFHHYVEDLQSTIKIIECWWVVSII